jgi:serine/threonine protein kinase
MTKGAPFGKYRLIRRLAQGGMAEVFLATQHGPSGFERTMAIKRILPHLAAQPEFIQMFMDEARVAAQLSHPNIAHIYDFGQIDDAFFIAMEYIDGVDLSHVLFDTEPIPFEHAARIVADVCAALHCAHTLIGPDGQPVNLVHRDISPQNILVSFGGVVKVVDFGIAKATFHVERTQPGLIRGKYTHMSPEQAEGTHVDGRADLFCAGIVLYELCTGRTLLPQDKPFEALRQILEEEFPRPLREKKPLPPFLEEIIHRSLAKKREERYPSAAAMQLDLETYLKSVPQISNTILLGDFFKTRYQRPRPTEELEQSSEAGSPVPANRKVVVEGTDVLAKTYKQRAQDKDITQPPLPLNRIASLHTCDTAPKFVSAPSRSGALPPPRRGDLSTATEAKTSPGSLHTQDTVLKFASNPPMRSARPELEREGSSSELSLPEFSSSTSFAEIPTGETDLQKLEAYGEDLAAAGKYQIHLATQLVAHPQKSRAGALGFFFFLVIAAGVVIAYFVANPEKMPFSYTLHVSEEEATVPREVEPDGAPVQTPQELSVKHLDVRSRTKGTDLIAVRIERDRMKHLHAIVKPANSEKSASRRAIKRNTVHTLERKQRATTIKETSSTSLRIDSNPSSYVFLDGKDVGSTPVIVNPVSPGKHKLQLRDTTTGKTHSQTITVLPGEKKKIKYDWGK